jgi:hypothetical protein
MKSAQNEPFRGMLVSNSRYQPPLIYQLMELFVEIIPGPPQYAENRKCVGTGRRGRLNGPKKACYRLCEDLPTCSISFVFQTSGEAAHSGPSFSWQKPVVIAAAHFPRIAY